MSHQVHCPSGSNSCTPTPSQLRLYQTFIFATPILFTCVLLVLFCLLYLRRRRNARAVLQIRAQFFARGLFAAPLDHGLNKSFRDNMPTLLFDAQFAESGGDTQCPVCLGDYQFNEKLQKLPTCGHTFHLDCIDVWLAGNSTCPICRTSLLQTGRIVPLASSPSHPNSALQQQQQQSQVSPICEEAEADESIDHVGSCSKRTVDQPPSAVADSHLIRIERV